MAKWKTENDATLFRFGAKWLWVNNAPLSNKKDFSAIKQDDGRTTVFIKNNYIKQKKSDLRFIPTYLDTNIDGQKLASAVYLLFFYRVKTAGRLRVEFEGLNQAGFEPFNAFSYDGDLEVCDGYKTFDCSGLWNGTGDFKLSFTGEINLYMLILSTDRAEALAYRYKTFFEQSEKLIKIAAANFDKYGNVLESSHIITTAKYNELISQRFNADGTLTNVSGLVTSADFANLFTRAMSDNGVVVEADIRLFITANDAGELISNATIKADQIQLEGLVTANQNFKILADGSIETKNGKFTGQINSNVGYIGGFEIGSGRIGSTATSSGESGGSLAIYNDFFRVGGNDGYVMFGNDVVPGSLGGAFTATGRIVNDHLNNNAYYGGSNYGLFIDVTGAKNNYGIWSNAPLCAPAFINTRVKELTFSGGTYQVDFSQHSVFLMKASQYSAVTLPSLSSVEDMFQTVSLPRDFGTLILFKVRTGSQNIILNNVYDQNENLINLEMASGDSAWVLANNMDGFRYNLLTAFRN